MLKESEVKDYFKREGTVSNWWNPETSDMSHIYTRQLDLVLKWLDKGGSQRVLDASCGKGRAIKRLSATHNVTGVDISKGMLDHVRNLELDRVDLVQSDVDRLPFRSEVFDSIVCLEALVHYPKPEIALREFRRVLKPQGLLVVDVDNENSLKGLVKKSSNALNRFFKEDFHPVSEGIFRPYKESELKGFIAQSGFVIQNIAHLGVLVPINLYLPGGKKIAIMSHELSKSATQLDQFFETFSMTSRLSTYTIALCKRN